MSSLSNILNNKILITIIIVASLFRLIFTIVNNKELQFSPDEHYNYQVAQNVHKGLGYVHHKGYGIFSSKKDKYVKTGFHPGFVNFTYQGLIKYNINQKVWIVFTLVLSLVFFIISIFYFKRILLMLKIQKKILYFTLFLFAFYPPYLYYIGSLFAYENIVLPLLIINFYYLLLFVINKDFSFLKLYHVIFLVFSITISCLFRPQLLLIYFVSLSILTLNVIFFRFNKQRMYYIFLFFLFISVSCAHLPILIKNYKLFNKPILSTQTGFELLQGHNPYARGSWNGLWHSPGNKLFEFVNSKNPAIIEVDEYQEALIRKNLAIDFIKENPFQELVLTLRKIAIFFLPQNYEILPTSNLYNPINLILHLLFFCSLFKLIYNYKQITNIELFVLSPIAGALLLSIIFFVGYRWRYYSEPFMILFVAISISSLIQNKLEFKNKPNY